MIFQMTSLFSTLCITMKYYFVYIYLHERYGAELRSRSLPGICGRLLVRVIPRDHRVIDVSTFKQHVFVWREVTSWKWGEMARLQCETTESKIASSLDCDWKHTSENNNYSKCSLFQIVQWKQISRLFMCDPTVICKISMRHLNVLWIYCSAQ